MRNSLNKAADEIRGVQIHVMESNVWKSLVGYLVGVAVSAWAAYDEWPTVLNIWVPLVFAVCGARIVWALRTALRPVKPLPLSAERGLVLWAALCSVTITIGPAWIALRSNGLISAIMITLIMSSLWGGALVQTALFSSARAYLALSVPVWIVSLVFAGANHGRVSLTILFVSSIIIAIDSSRRYAMGFERNQQQNIDLAAQGHSLKQQADVIGLLLKEHEDQSSDWLWQTDAQGRIINPSARFAEGFETTTTALEGRALYELFAAEDIPGNSGALHELSRYMGRARTFSELIVPGMLASGMRWWSVSGRSIMDENGAVSGFRGVMGDVTEAKQAQAQIVHLAHHDGLTGLANRTWFRERLNALLASPTTQEFGLISIDLDGFKPVNDRYGHPIGDALLVCIGERLRAVARGGTVARLGGDEFAIELDICQQDAMEAFCRHLLTILSAPCSVAGHDISVGASIGVAFAPRDGATTEELIRNVDTALYRAKHDGRGTYRFFMPDMGRQLQQHLSLLQDLREASRKEQFVLEYQPLVDAITGGVTGCEALIRWRHPTRGLIMALDFIPLAENSGLIRQIGAWVIENACKQAASWSAEKRIAVKVSPAQLGDRELPRLIFDALANAGLPPQRLELEITDALLIEDTRLAFEQLRRIQDSGVRIALDDFGGGYSTLSYLRDFPFNRVKIDRSFVAGVEGRRDNQVIIKAIRDIAYGLGMAITAMGVETQEQAEELRRMGCHELQGFFYGKPGPDTAVPALFVSAGPSRSGPLLKP